MQKIVLVSYPRSGSNLMYNLIKHYFEMAEEPLSSCVYYGKCESIPCMCIQPATLTKTHDSENLHQINLNLKYIVIYRKDKIKNIEAYLRLINAINNGYENIRYESKTKLQPDFFKNTTNIERVKMCFKQYDQFVKKYDSNMKNMLVIKTEEIMENLQGVFERCLIFLGQDAMTTSNKGYIEQIINSTELQFTKIEDKSYFDWVESEIKKIVE